MTRPTVDVHVGIEGFAEVRCTISRLEGQQAALQLDGVRFRDLTDESLQQIADAIELYLIRKNQRERKLKRANQGADEAIAGDATESGRAIQEKVK